MIRFLRESVSALRHALTHDRAVSLLLGLLLLADVGFLLLNFAPAPPALRDGRLLLEFDQGFAEVFQYVKLFWAAVLLTALALQRKRVAYGLWALLFFYLMLDDALSIHESLGIDWLNIERYLGSVAHEMQELIFVLLVLGPVMLLLAATYHYGSPLYKAESRPLWLLMGALAFFGVVVDKLRGALGSWELLDILVGAIEDWGEMVVVSFIVAYLFILLINGMDNFVEGG